MRVEHLRSGDMFCLDEHSHERRYFTPRLGAESLPSWLILSVDKRKGKSAAATTYVIEYIRFYNGAAEKSTTQIPHGMEFAQGFQLIRR